MLLSLWVCGGFVVGLVDFCNLLVLILDCLNLITMFMIICLLVFIVGCILLYVFVLDFDLDVAYFVVLVVVIVGFCCLIPRLGFVVLDLDYFGLIVIRFWMI